MESTITQPIPTAPQSPLDQMHQTLVELEEISRRTVRHESLLAQIATTLKETGNAMIVAHLSSGPQIPESQPCLQVLTSRYESLSDSSHAWMTQVGLQAIETNQVYSKTITCSEGNRIQFVASPVSGSPNSPAGESLIGMFAVSDQDTGLGTSILKLASHAIAHWKEAGQLRLAHQLAEDTAALNEMGSLIESSASTDIACQKIANQLAKHITSDSAENKNNDPKKINHVKIYVATSSGQHDIRLVAESDSETVPAESSLIESIEAAMRECISRNSNTNWPPLDHDRHALLCHQRLSGLLNQTRIMTLALHDPQGDLQGALLITSQSVLADHEQRLVCSCTQPFSSTLGLIKRAQQNRIQRAWDSIRESMQTQKAKVAFKCAALIFAIGMIPLPYKVRTQSELQPAFRQFVCAPFESQLKECRVEPGDVVQKNQIIAKLDEKEIKLELAEIQADYHRASKKQDGFLASHRSGEARLAQHEAEKLQAKSELLTHRNGNLDLRSPISGIVISGDLKKAEGMPLETGQSLFEIAPLDNLTVELFVPEDDVRYIQPGMQVRININAFPFENWHGEIVRIHPAAEIRENENVFIATVNLPNPNGKLRPGMQGSAKITTLWRPICWNLLHKPIAKCLRWAGW